MHTQVVTRDCAGCDGNNEGGTFEVAVTNSIGVAGCTTPKLDKAGTTDYGAGNTATFSGDELGPNSGGCKLVCYTNHNITAPMKAFAELFLIPSTKPLE